MLRDSDWLVIFLIEVYEYPLNGQTIVSVLAATDFPTGPRQRRVQTLISGHSPDD